MNDELTCEPPFELIKRLYGCMTLTRSLEERILDLFADDEITGTTHTYIGQEAIAAAVLDHITRNDVVFSNHRCHGHYLAYGGPVGPLIAEIMGREGGLCGGRGGSQHLTYRNFHTNGIQGGIVANCTGAAMAKKLKKHDGIGVVFLGDGTLGEGIVYESMNLASLWDIPVLYVLEDNRIAQSTPVELAIAGSMVARARAFGIRSDEIETNDAVILHSIFAERFNQVRHTGQPFLQVVHTYRLGPHSKSDDYRSPKDLKVWRENDPLLVMERYIDDQTRLKIDDEMREKVENAVNNARTMPFPRVDINMIDSIDTLSPPAVELVQQKRGEGGETVLRSLTNGLHDMLDKNCEVVVIGQDLLDPYGGAFKVTKGLSTTFPERILTTPISEAAIVGLSVGMAMYGMRPVVEIMFGDFLTLCADQLINHASKYGWMYNDKVSIPLVVRTAMGGRRGYGPTHSQSLEKLFMGVPGLAVVSPSHLHDPGALLTQATLNVDVPVLFVEHKLLYPQLLQIPVSGRVENFFVNKTNRQFPTIHLSLTDFDQPDATLVTYGGNLPLAMEAAEVLLLDDEINLDIVVPSLIAPLPIDDIVNMVGRSPVVASLEEGTRRQGWGSEVVASLEEASGGDSRRYVRIATPDSLIPSSKPLEIELLPDLDLIVGTIRDAVS